MTFTPDVYEIIRNGCIRSARWVVPVLCETFRPKTVVDVGGGEGWWAREFVSACFCDATVLDESAKDRPPPYEGPRCKEIFEDHLKFLPLDLENEPIGDARYDLALCLEVAEHLEGAAADRLIEQLCEAAPVVVFSAAIPGQGGHGHVNEQWTAYWYAKFAEHGFECYDFLRWRFWDNEDVEPWYRQNLLVYARDLSPNTYDRMLEATDDLREGPPLDVVHPTIFRHRTGG